MMKKYLLILAMIYSGSSAAGFVAPPSSVGSVVTEPIKIEIEVTRQFESADKVIEKKTINLYPGAPSSGKNTTERSFISDCDFATVKPIEGKSPEIIDLPREAEEVAKSSKFSIGSQYTLSGSYLDQGIVRVSYFAQFQELMDVTAIKTLRGCSIQQPSVSNVVINENFSAKHGETAEFTSGKYRVRIKIK